MSPCRRVVRLPAVARVLRTGNVLVSGITRVGEMMLEWCQHHKAARAGIRRFTLIEASLDITAVGIVAGQLLPAVRAARRTRFHHALEPSLTAPEMSRGHARPRQPAVRSQEQAGQ